jgi:hypothetical protein
MCVEQAGRDTLADMGDFIDRWLNRDLHRMLHPPRLHPKMRERMWKPGQSGNPSGMNSIVQAARERREPPNGDVSTRRLAPRACGERGGASSTASWS